MQALFAIIFCFFVAFVSPFAQALTIAAPSSGLTTGNGTISCTVTTSDTAESLSFFIQRNSTRLLIAQDVAATPAANAVSVPVVVPSGVSGGGWVILAAASNNPSNILAESGPFEIRETAQTQRMGAAVVGGVIIGVVLFALLVLGGFMYFRRRQRRLHGPTNPNAIDLEAAMAQARDHSRSFSREEAAAKESNKWSEEDKVEWERELEEQFARAQSRNARCFSWADPTGRRHQPASRAASTKRYARLLTSLTLEQHFIPGLTH
ncbi:hypothetical protein HMN09_00829600 [Mycena chlorophos]|uniref:Uncharacterized protein n=1 Tax=Mycena chlorophos TaxID=658473 RepID=A0A8H6SRQ1_MYCCL|nr:hypothetical protein HMN09_00829600 [Mycena chlorophos]